MLPLPGSSPSPTLLPKGHYVVTTDLVTALGKIPGAVDCIEGTPPDFPEHDGPWLILPNGTNLSVYEDTADGGRLLCEHVGSGSTFDKDQAVLDHYLD